MSWRDRIARILVEAASGPRYPAPRAVARDSLMGLYSNKIDDVPVSFLKQLPGNDLRQSDEWLRELGKDISARGLQDPLIINIGKNSGTGMLGEGNHRLQALINEGYTHAPARVIVGREYGSRVMPAEFLRPDLLPQAGQYFPADARPSEVFGSLRDYMGGR